jgi:hypothetical protein
LAFGRPLVKRARARQRAEWATSKDKPTREERLAARCARTCGDAKAQARALDRQGRRLFPKRPERG